MSRLRFIQVLAALDVHTSRWIINKCFKGDLVRGRTVLLVVSQIMLTRVFNLSLDLPDP
jgi:hypothetical protein